MAWSYTTGVLTSTGATEGAPDSLLAGIDVVEAAAPTLGYRDGNVGWLAGIQIVVAGSSFIRFDTDSAIEFRTTTRITGTAGGAIVGGVIHGQRSTLIINKSGTNFSVFGTGATFITQKDRPQDPNARIIQTNNVRVDYPTMGAVGVANTLAKIDVNGLDYYSLGTTSDNLVSRFYAVTSVSTNISGIRLFSGLSATSLTFLILGATYSDLYSETLALGSESGIINDVTLLRPTFYRATAVPLGGLIRSCRMVFRNPTFLNNCWDGTFALNGNLITADNSHNIQYTFANIFREGVTNLSGVTVRYTPAQQSGTSVTWTPPATAQVQSAISGVDGTFAPLNLTDTYRTGVTLNSIERYNWSGKARRYDKKTATEKLFENRILYQGSTNLSQGYTEEIQMLSVPHLTLTSVQAAALTGFAFAPVGETGGVVTVSSARTVSELWQYYRSWIATLANFDSNDTWTYDGTTLNMGAWTITGIQNLTTGTIVTSSATATGAINNLTVTGNVIQNTPTSLNGVTITGNLTYNINTPVTITYTNTNIGTVANNGTGIVTINRVNSNITNYSDAEINFIDSSLSVLGSESTTFYPTALDRDSNINASGTFTTALNFKFGSIINGTTMSGTIYLRCLAGGVTFGAEINLVLGVNILDLGVNAQLALISAKVDLTAKESTLLQTETDIINVVNNEAANAAARQVVLLNEFSLTNAAVSTVPSSTVTALNATTIPVNVTQVTGATITGAGTELDPWGP